MVRLSPLRKALTATLCIAVFAVAGTFLYAAPSSALSGSEFQAGRIIDDGIFNNPNAMSPQQIQNFLNAKVPQCDNWGTQPYAGTTRRAYSEARGIKFPLVCIKDYYENPSNRANNLEGRSIPSGAKSAAQIIYDAGKKYSINPKVLLVMLQKEQALVLDDWPWPVQYEKALGFGCPDTAPCNTEYYGFYNQVENAARQLRRYAQYPNSYGHIAGANNQVRYNPNASCGTSTVYIRNQATASLYNYTPYQPNQAALSNLYGTGDSCSAYGNRNFWRYFRDWFGSTYDEPFMWQVTDLFILDEGKNIFLPTDYLHKGERLHVTVKGKNTGTETWYRDGVNPARLGTWSPNDRRSEICDRTWLNFSPSCNRSAKLVEESVPPGGTFHFEMYMFAPNQGGQFREYFKPLLESRAWMTNETGSHIYINSTSYYAWGWRYIDAWTNSSKTTKVNTANLAKGQQFYVELRVKNNSATVWKKAGSSPATLGTQNPQDHNSQLCVAGWLACNRPTVMKENEVKPGQDATFGFMVKAPNNLGEYREYFTPLLENKGWMRPDSNHLYLKVTH